GGAPGEFRGHGAGRHRGHAPWAGHQHRSAHRIPRHPLRVRGGGGGRTGQQRGGRAVAALAGARVPYRGGLRRHPARPHRAPARHLRGAGLLVENYLIAMATFAGLYALLALGLNLVLVGFYAFGAYVSALLTKKAGWPMPAGLLAAMLLTAAAGVLMALVTA